MEATNSVIEPVIDLEQFTESTTQTGKNGSILDIEFKPSSSQTNLTSYLQILALHLHLRLLEIFDQHSAYKVSLSVRLNYVKNYGAWSRFLHTMSSNPQVLISDCDLHRSIQLMTDQLLHHNAKLSNEKWGIVIEEIFSAKLHVICLLPAVRKSRARPLSSETGRISKKPKFGEISMLLFLSHWILLNFLTDYLDLCFNFMETIVLLFNQQCWSQLSRFERAISTRWWNARGKNSRSSFWPRCARSL